MEIKNIVFYYPSKITGGAEYLFMRCSDYLANHQDKYRIYFVDYNDGFARRNLHSEKVKFIDYRKEEITIIPNHSVVIVQLNLISQMDSRFEYNQDQTIFLYWCLHTLNIKNQIFTKGHYFLFRKERKRLGEAIRILSEMNVIKYMGYGANIRVLKDLYQEPQKLLWLPNIAPIDEHLPFPKIEKPSENNLRFCWLGRLDNEKARNVITYMNELEDCNKIHKLSLSIIGVGPAYDYLNNIARQYSYPINFVGEKRDEYLDDYIRNHTDIGLASGTSAFEFSMRGKPVIIDWVLARIYEAGERTCYTFTFNEAIGYNEASGEIIREGQDKFISKLEELLDNYEDISKKCFDYILTKSPSRCTAILLKTIGQLIELNQDEVRQHLFIVRSIINRAKKRILLLHKIIHPFT